MMAVKRRHALLFIALIFTALVAAGCGYRVAGRVGSDKGGELPWDVSSMAIPNFENRTHKANVEAVLTRAVIDEFINTVKIAKPAEAEAVLYGSVSDYRLEPISFSSSDVVVRYRLHVTFSVRIVRTSDKSVLWKDSAVSDYEDFDVDSSSINATESAEREALSDLSRDIARLVKERILEGL